MEKARLALQACARGMRGTADARLVVAGSGRVVEAAVHGVFFGRPQGKCMARRLQRLRFPVFGRPRQQVSHSFVL